MMKPDRAHGTRNSVFVTVFNVYFSKPLGHIEPSNERDSPANSDRKSCATVPLKPIFSAKNGPTEQPNKK